jgi:23S rRNA pseudouridine1911/1915/1917 synthase
MDAIIREMEPFSVIEVAAKDEGLRLDVLLARELRLGRRQVRRLLDRESVQIAGRPAPKGLLLRAGDRIEVQAFRHPDQGPLADPDLQLLLLAENDELLALDKPAGVPSAPLEFDETGTAVGAALARWPEIRNVGDDPLEAGLVHRLDNLTSGVLVFAKTRAAWIAARSAFEARTVDKRYIARVHGLLREPRTLELRLESRGSHVRVVSRGGQPSITRVEPIEQTAATTLVEAQPVTGVRHQIRVALAHLGHPIVGDSVYGSRAQLDRHLLHAASIRIGNFEASSAPPAELAADPR